MNILKWFKRGKNTPPKVSAPAKEPEPISELAKNVVKLFDEDKIERVDVRTATGPASYSWFQPSIYVIIGTEHRLVSGWYTLGVWIVKLGDYVFNRTEQEHIAAAVNRFNERRHVAEEKDKNKRIKALRDEIARIANQTTDNNQNED